MSLQYHYMIARSYDHHKVKLGKRIYCITEFYDGFHCFLIKEYRRVFMTDAAGRPIKMFDEYIPLLRFLKIPHLKLDCQLLPQDNTLSGEERKLAARDLARSKRREPGKVKLIVNDTPTFAKQDFTYRRAMLDYYITDNELIQKNPILFTGYSTQDIDRWYQWAVDNNKDGINIILKEARYILGPSDHFFVKKNVRKERL